MKTSSTHLNSQPPLVLQACLICGLDFAITEGFYQVRRHDGEAYSCPNGHRQRFVTEAEEKEEARSRFSPADYADNGMLRSQVEFLSGKLKEAQQALKAAGGAHRRRRGQAGSDDATRRAA